MTRWLLGSNAMTGMAAYFVPDAVLLGAALYHRNWPPRRWVAAYGVLAAIRLDGAGDLLREMVREYRTVRRSKERRIGPVKGGTW